LEALIVCEKLNYLLQKEKKIHGYVHSVFNNALNIEAGDKFITILTSNRVMAPMSTIIAKTGYETINFKNLNIIQNSEFELCEGSIYCKEKNINIELLKAKLWSPKVRIKPNCCTLKKLEENMKVIEKGITIHGKLNGIGPLVNTIGNAFSFLDLIQLDVKPPAKEYEFIQNRFIGFINALINMNIEKIGILAKGIIGYGIGLTPAMDDFICGLMICFVYLGINFSQDIHKIYEFNEKIITEGIEKTTRVSSEMLKYSAVGETNEAVRGLMEAILYKSRENIISNLVNTIMYGETSGSDTLLGIYVGYKIIANSYLYKYQNNI
jgi:hypothetical protein